MLRQATFQVWAEKEKEQKEYSKYSAKRLTFNKTDKGLTCVTLAGTYLIVEFRRADTFGKKFEVFFEGKSQDTFYTLANAKRFISSELEELEND